MLNVIQHGITIAKGGYRSFRKWQGWRRAVIEILIKEPLFVHLLSGLFSLDGFENLGLVPKKGASLWAEP
jgi:hypothetical protein